MDRSYLITFVNGETTRVTTSREDYLSVMAKYMEENTIVTICGAIINFRYVTHIRVHGNPS